MYLLFYGDDMSTAAKNMSHIVSLKKQLVHGFR